MRKINAFILGGVFVFFIFFVLFVVTMTFVAVPIGAALGMGSLPDTFGDWVGFSFGACLFACDDSAGLPSLIDIITAPQEADLTKQYVPPEISPEPPEIPETAGIPSESAYVEGVFYMPLRGIFMVVGVTPHREADVPINIVAVEEGKIDTDGARLATALNAIQHMPPTSQAMLSCLDEIEASDDASGTVIAGVSVIVPEKRVDGYYPKEEVQPWICTWEMIEKVSDLAAPISGGDAVLAEIPLDQLIEIKETCIQEMRSRYERSLIDYVNAFTSAFLSPTSLSSVGTRVATCGYSSWVAIAQYVIPPPPTVILPDPGECLPYQGFSVCSPEEGLSVLAVAMAIGKGSGKIYSLGGTVFVNWSGGNVALTPYEFVSVDAGEEVTISCGDGNDTATGIMPEGSNVYVQCVDKPTGQDQ